ncbi:MAG: cytochrome c/FTR1 family iron permease [Caldimonas sp.]
MGWFRRFACVVALGLISLGVAAAAADSIETARRTWQLLDYIAVDYSGAVAGGKVSSESEFAEMSEFAETVERNIATLPAGVDRARLQSQGAELKGLVTSKADAATVASKAHGLASELLKSYPFPLSPARAPDLAKGATLFASECSACHGPTGHADGPLAAGLNPHPTALADRSRAGERSIAALFQVISQGVSGTAMPSFKERLSDEDRWAVAFFAGSLAYSDAERSRGLAIWKSSPVVRESIGNLDALAQMSERALATKTGPAVAAPALAWARSHPGELASSGSSPTSLSRSKLTESLAAIRAGDRAGATRLALSAYLDGFEPLEPSLKARDAALMGEVETAMGNYRSKITSGTPAEVESSANSLLALFDRVDSRLAPSENDALSTFIGALTILLREGVEALLVVVAMIAFLRKAERPDVLRYVHAGWVVALAGGGVTWLAATYLVGISGASRELTEGFSSLFAAVVLLGVGMWMHQKSVAGRWQFYLQGKLSAALNSRTAWLLFGLSFVAVYREVFETVLFYAALWTEGNGLPLLAGLGCGLAVLGVLAAILLRTSARLPIGKFFAASSLLVAVLAVVLAGKGTAALQEAGVLSVDPVPFPRIDVLGVHPSAQTLISQAAVLVVVVITYLVNTRRRHVPRAGS